MTASCGSPWTKSCSRRTPPGEIRATPAPVSTGRSVSRYRRTPGAAPTGRTAPPHHFLPPDAPGRFASGGYRPRAKRCRRRTTSSG
jgi:hypothetical protein